MYTPSILERMYLHDPAQFAPMPSRVSAQEAEEFRRKLQDVSPALAEEFRYLWSRLCFQEQQRLAALFAQGARVGAQLKLELQDPYEKYIDHTVGPVTRL